MAEACSTEVCEVDQDQPSAVCPRCGGKGKPVSRITVRYLVQGRFQGEIQDSLSYRFCLSTDCPVVYFSEKEGSLFTKDQVSERVTIKEKEDPLPLCYCFNFLRHDVEEEIRRTGKTSIQEFITAQVKAGNCFCEYTNPEGTCCLGHVSTVVKQVREKGG